MENTIIKTEEMILLAIKEKEGLSLDVLETRVDSSPNLFFLALDKLSRENRILLTRNGYDYKAFINSHCKIKRSYS
ncbi:MAG: hypothetical protein ACE5EA_02955 [Nitrospirota bacterium]